MLEKIIKSVLKKRVLVTLITIEISSIIAIFWTAAKRDASPYKGDIIDGQFLDALVVYEYYSALQEIFFAIFIFFTTAVIVYTIAYIKYKKGIFLPKDQGLLLGCLALIIITIAFTTPTILDIKERGSKKPFVRVENIVDKRIYTHKSGDNYYLIFNRGSKYKVSQNTFPLFHTGTPFYMVYQGKSLIHIFPVGRYKLKND